MKWVLQMDICCVAWIKVPLSNYSFIYLAAYTCALKLNYSTLVPQSLHCLFTSKL